MEIGFLGILFGYFLPMSKYVIGISILILLFDILKDLNKLSKYIFIFILFYMIVGFNVKTSDISFPKNISTKGVVVDDYANDELKYVVKISNRTNIILYSKQNLRIGDVIDFSGKVNKPVGKMNSTDFDYKAYLLSKNIKANVFSNGEKLIGENKVLGFREKFKSHVNNSFYGISEKHGEFLKSVILSDSNYIDEQNLAVYRNLGIMHLIAMSGFHIGIVLGALEIIFKFIKIPKVIRRVTSIFITYVYIWLVGLPVAALRAFIMASCQLLAFLMKKKYSALSSLKLSALIILILNPYNIASSSFWMSYMAVLGILLFYKRYDYFFKRNFLMKSFGVSLGVFVALAPVMAYFFYEINFLSIVSNVVLVPIYSIAIILAFVNIFTPLGILVKPSIEVLLMFTDFISNLIELNLKIPVPKPSLAYIFILYLGLFFIVNDISLKKYELNKFAFVSIACVLIFLGAQSVIDCNTLQINSIYVGQGDCTHISYRGKNYIIDTGGSHGDFRPGKIYLLNYLKGKGINIIDKLFISHFDEDHVDGVLDLIGNIKIKNSYVPYLADNKYVRVLKKNSDLHIFTKNSYLKTNGLKFESLNDYSPYREENENSMVMLMNFNGFNALFTGDSNCIKEFDRNVDFLKVAHHGSKNSTSEIFLNSTRPKFATISAGIDNSYGHPHIEILKMLNSIGTNYKVTASVGEINFYIGREIKFKGFLEKNNYIYEVLAIVIDLIIIILFLKKNEKVLRENYDLSRTL